MREKIKSLSDIINGEKEFVHIREKIKSQNALEKFYEVFPDLKKIAEPVKVEKQTLFLRVENSTWRSELNLQRKAIIEKLNNHLKENTVKSIRFI